MCVNAATVALMDAGIPMRDFISACSASYIEDTPILGETRILYYHVFNLILDCIL